MARIIKTFENFQSQDHPDLDPAKADELKPKSYLYTINNDNGEFSADVRSEDGKCILSIDGKFIDDGNMEHKEDLSGLREYLISKKKMRQHDELFMNGNLTQRTLAKDPAVTESLVMGFDTWINEEVHVDSIAGGRADDKNPEDFDQFELDLGKEIEKEHTDSDKTATEIAMDHLYENPKYYSEGLEKGIFDEDISSVLNKWKDDPRAIKLKEIEFIKSL